MRQFYGRLAPILQENFHAHEIPVLGGGIFGFLGGEGKCPLFFSVKRKKLEQSHGRLSGRRREYPGQRHHGTPNR